MFLNVTPLKVGLHIRGVARVCDNSTEKSTNGLRLVCNLIVPVSSTGKPQCFQIALFVLKLGFAIWSNSFTVDISVYTQAED